MPGHFAELYNLFRLCLYTQANTYVVFDVLLRHTTLGIRLPRLKNRDHVVAAFLEVF